MDGHDLGLLAEGPLIDGLELPEQGGLEVGHPAGIAAVQLGLGPGQGADGHDDAAGGLERRGDRAAGAAEDLEVLLAGLDDGQVGRGLGQAGDLGMHGDHPVRQSGQEVEQGPLATLRQGAVLAVDRLDRAGGARLDGLVLDLDLVEGLLDGVGHGPDLDRRAGQHGHGLAGDGVVLAAALDRDELELGRRLGFGQDAGQELDGVAAALVDVEARVAAAESGDVDPIEVLGGLAFPFERQGQAGVGAAGATDGERALVLAVEVEEHLAGEEALGDLVGPGQPGLLVDREQELEGAVDERLVLHHGQGGGQADAVVGAEGRALGVDPFAPDLGQDGVLAEIVDLVRVLLADHVQVALEDGPHGRLAAGRRRLADQDVADLVALARQAQGGGDRKDMIPEGLFAARAMGDGQDLGEMLPEKLGIEIGERSGHE